MRAAALMMTALALGAAVVLRHRRDVRDRNARAWADATDPLETTLGGVAS